MGVIMENFATRKELIDKWAARAREKTHCKNGHEFSESNTRMATVWVRGKQYATRKCRACEREYRKKTSRTYNAKYNASKAERARGGRALLKAATDKNRLLWAALEESVRLQNQYAVLLNLDDGGARLQFNNARAWIDRLIHLGRISSEVLNTEQGKATKP